MTPVGIVLAAGQGRRMGRPKALLTLPGGTSYLGSACRALLRAGCQEVIAVLGASATAAQGLLEQEGLLAGAHPVTAVLNPDWEQGMSTSLRVALANLPPAADVAVVHLVDLPDVSAEVVARLLAKGVTEQENARSALARAAYDGVPGHPVLLGRDHWPGILDSLAGDAGARGYFRTYRPALVEMNDLATGRDVDTPSERLKFEAEQRQ